MTLLLIQATTEGIAEQATASPLPHSSLRTLGCPRHPPLFGEFRKRLRVGLELIAQRGVVAPFQTSLLALAFSRFNQVLEASRTHDGGFSTLSASRIPLHAELILPLP